MMSLMELLCSQLKREARSIYDTYLSDSAPYSVNIDDTAKTEEKDLEQPTPDMFNKAQTQVCLESTLPLYTHFDRWSLIGYSELGLILNEAK